MPLRDETFTLTEEHVKLMRRMFTGWCDDEFGAPEIDPKRPYGNGNVLGDIHEILTGVDVDILDEDTADYHYGKAAIMENAERYHALHKSMETALQVVLRTGSFEPGEYRAPYCSTDWKKV